MLKAGQTKAPVWPKVKSSTSAPSLSSLRSPGHPAGSDESDNEDKVPVPEYSSSFGHALQAAFDTIPAKTSTLHRLAAGSCVVMGS